MSHPFPGRQRRTKPVTTGTVAWPSKTPRRRNRSWTFRARLCAALRPMRYSLVSLIVLAAAAVPSPQASAADPAPPRTSWGQPDLRGIWDFRTITPLQRPEDLGDTEILSTEEAAELQEQLLKRRNNDNRPSEAARDVAKAYNDFWLDYGKSLIEDKRTSLIVDPPDGRIPPLTAPGKRRQDARKAAMERPAHGPEDRGPYERCLTGFNAGPPMRPGGYNNNVQIFQTPESVALLVEMVHDTRIVPLDGSPHVPEDVRQWKGDSRGHWEGDTLVVETRNFTDKNPFYGSGKGMHLRERFTRVDADTLLYEFTIDDPESFTKPWSVSVPMKKNPEPIYEYACHEGNYSMLTMLKGARADDKAAEEAAKKQAAQPALP